MKFIDIKTEGGTIKGKIAFYCSALGVTRQGFYWYLKHRDAPWKYEGIAVFFGEHFSPFSSLWFPIISAVYSCGFIEYQYITENSRTHSRRYRGWNPWFYGNVSIKVIKAWMSNYNCLTMMILRRRHANYGELTSLINSWKNTWGRGRGWV